MQDDERYKTIEGLIEALQIIAKYNGGGLKAQFILMAEHDIIWMDSDLGPPAEDSDDGKRLIELGWHYDRSAEVWAYFT